MEKATFRRRLLLGRGGSVPPPGRRRLDRRRLLGRPLPEPDYHDVCSGGTGHAESVQVEYDPARVSYEQLLDVFWRTTTRPS